MKRIIAVIIILLMLAACTWRQTLKTSEPTAVDTSPANIANPTSVYCEQQGNHFEICTAANGDQYGVCVFPNGSSCDEWAYFHGECGMETLVNPKLDQIAKPTSNASGGYIQPGTSEPIEDWWGVIKSTEPGAQSDDYFEREDLGGAIFFGIASLDPEVEAQIEALRDSSRIVHIYGTLLSNVSDYNGSQVQVDHLVIQE